MLPELIVTAPKSFMPSPAPLVSSSPIFQLSSGSVRSAVSVRRTHSHSGLPGPSGRTAVMSSGL
jgi:hypothetical protein